MNMSSWDESARQYDAFEKKWHHYEKIANDLVKQLPIHGSSKVLELACGTGACTILLAKISIKGKINGIDSSAEMVRIAKENMIDYGLSNVTLLWAMFLNWQICSHQVNLNIVLCAILRSGNFLIRSQFSDESSLVCSRTRGKFGFNLPRWFPSDEARDSFSEKSTRNLESPRTTVPGKRYSLRNQTTDYQEILIKPDSRSQGYTIRISKSHSELTKEWREIPAFSRFISDLQRCRKRSSMEIRKEFQKMQGQTLQKM